MLGPGEGRQKDQLHYSLFTQAATSLTSLQLNVCRTATPYCHRDYSSINLLALTILNNVIMPEVFHKPLSICNRQDT